LFIKKKGYHVGLISNHGIVTRRRDEPCHMKNLVAGSWLLYKAVVFIIE
jgi:hypothetical protein